MASHITDWQREDYRAIERRQRYAEEREIDLAMRTAFKALAEDGICPKCLRPLADWPLTAPHSVAECRGSLESAEALNGGSGSP